MWFTAAAQLIGQQAATPMLNTGDPYAAQEQSGSTMTMLVAGGLILLVGGAAYVMLKSPARSRRMGRSRR